MRQGPRRFAPDKTALNKKGRAVSAAFLFLAIVFELLFSAMRLIRL